MNSIDSAAASAIQESLSKALSSLARNVAVEVQDEGEFLLVRIEMDSYEQPDALRILKDAASVLNMSIRPRPDDFAWMVNVEFRGALVDSEVGGKE